MPDYGLLLELHAVTLAGCSYVLLDVPITLSKTSTIVNLLICAILDNNSPQVLLDSCWLVFMTALSQFLQMLTSQVPPFASMVQKL